jgi:hypothetical protein
MEEEKNKMWLVSELLFIEGKKRNEYTYWYHHHHDLPVEIFHEVHCPMLMLHLVPLFS